MQQSHKIMIRNILRSMCYLQYLEFSNTQVYSIRRKFHLPETKSPNIRTEAHGSELDLKFGCYIFYIGNPNTYVLPGIPGIPGIYTNQQQ
jgi:hypothetical protein